jgi:hypothetical protein
MNANIKRSVVWDTVLSPSEVTDAYNEMIIGLTDPSATGDPHLTNLHGIKFDIHDGSHRLVHYPRNAPEEEALFKVDAIAVSMGHVSDCYNVYLQSIQLSGKWMGDRINISANTHASKQISSPSNFGMSFAGEQMEWPALARQRNANLLLKGSMPVTVAASTRRASSSDDMGGEALTFKIGDQLPLFVEVWSSHGQNSLTHSKEVRYLNMVIKNLPEDSGGIIGLDSYVRPPTSQCGLVQAERDLATFVSDKLSLLRTEDSVRVHSEGNNKQTRFRWTASAKGLRV